MKPFSESCEQNKLPILDVLKREFAHAQQVLEIGSGTGQHAVFFARELPHLHWHTSDMEENLAGIRLWLDEAGLANISQPINLNVNQDNWPVPSFDGIFSANTAHIMDWGSVENMFAGVGRVLQTSGRFCLYGPFNYNGEFSSESNARFDIWLKQRDAQSGVRCFEELDALANRNGMFLHNDHEMPVNNRILVWQKQ